jgi:3-(3-hydroxy-phenyl)propionate hydroxylase
MVETAGGSGLPKDGDVSESRDVVPAVPVAPVPVVIVGAGPTGLAAAILLAQYGVACTVLERWPDIYPGPRAVHLDDEVYRILARMGLGDAFAAISRAAAGLRLLDPDLGLLAEFPRDAAVGRHGFPSANMYDQPDLERLLRDRAAALELVTVRGAVEVTGLDRSSPDRVGVELHDRIDGRAHRIAARYVLGCDGANSVVRQAVGGRVRDLGFAQRWLVVDVRSPHDLGRWGGVHQVCDPQRAATYMQIGADRHRWEFRLRDHESVETFRDLARLAELLTPWTGVEALGDLEVVRVAEYTFRAQLADRWRVGRVFLLGDAAHLTPPFIGQGLGAGQRDAMNLAWKLASVLGGSMPDAVLDSYPVEREPHVRDLIRIAVALGRAMTQGGRAGDVARRMIVPRLHLVPGLRRRVTDSASPPLRSSALVQRRGPGSLAGTLAPNVVLEGGCRFDDLVAGRFALVTTVTPTPAQRDRVDDAGAVVVLTAPTDELGRWLRRWRARGAVVRPDGTVLAAGRSVGRLYAQLPGAPVRDVRPGSGPAPEQPARQTASR